MKTGTRTLLVLALLASIVAVVAMFGLRAAVHPEETVALLWDLERGVAAPYVLESPGAKLTVTVFGDFECEGCSVWARTAAVVIFEEVKRGTIKLEFFDYPLSHEHAHSLSAHVAAGCAAEQGRFWEMHDQLFAARNEWRTGSTRKPREVLKRYARLMHLDLSAWERCYDERRPLPRITANQKVGEQLGLRAIPAVRISNVFVAAADIFSEVRLRSIIDSSLAEAVRRTANVPQSTRM